MAVYANVIVDISHEKLDKTFQYRVPEELKERLEVGMQVQIPFGTRTINGYVVELTQEAEYEVSKIRPLLGISEDGVAIESQLIALASWMKRNYGSTMNQALKTVLPIRRRTKEKQRRFLKLLLSEKEAAQQLALLENRHATAMARLLRELMQEKILDYAIVTQKLHISPAAIKRMQELGILRIDAEQVYRNPVHRIAQKKYDIELNDRQKEVVNTVQKEFDSGLRTTYLLKGVTGSGKTEVYMELIAHMIQQGRQAIVLIPEIALTYQTVMRFYNRFGDRVSILNSRLSAGERYDQYLRAKNGDIDIMIGPRSALFAPFARLGLIIIDEEHETSYKSETVPRYHARETAIERARLCGASVLLGSATPSVESYYRAQCGIYRLLELTQRVEEKPLPECEVVDLREELRDGNRSILSRRLQELMEERLSKKQQIMLFLNRRGISGVVACRACGEAVKCPHCDVTLSQHGDGRMVCHYCGYTEPVPHVCPSCSSKYISGFKAGTQKIELLVKERFPDARVLRMDFDTTREKDGYEKILQAFGSHEADILIGTQMIVKGHDFANVTLMGILAADLSLYASDFHAAERTFQLLTQAAGRVGRGKTPGQVVIQSYAPQHYAVRAAQTQDYEAFYRQEMEYRKLLSYPPVWNLLVVLLTSFDEKQLETDCEKLKEFLDGWEKTPQLWMIGPADASVAKLNDLYRKVIYFKTADYRLLVRIKDAIEKKQKEQLFSKEVKLQFDFNPMSGF